MIGQFWRLFGDFALKVRVVGFDLQIEGTVTFDQLWQSLPNSLELEFRRHDRFFYFAERDGYLLGLLVTSKDHRTSLHLRRRGGAIQINVARPEEGDELADFNVVVLHPKTLRGLYLQYRGSCNVGVFGDILASLFAREVEKQKQEALGKVDGGPYSKATRTVKAQFKACKLKLTQMIRKGQLEELLRRLKVVKDFQFEYATLVSNRGAFSPLDGSVSRETHKLTFRTDVTTRSVNTAIVNVVRSLGLTSGTIHGISRATELEDTIDLALNPDVFQTFDFDDIADDQAFNLADVAHSSLAELMLRIARDNHALLSTPTV